MIKVSSRTQKAIDSTINILEMLGPTTEKAIRSFKESLDACKTEQEIINILISVPHYGRFDGPSKLPTQADIDRVIKAERLIVSEKIRINHVKNGVIAAKEFCIYPLTVRRNQQVITKESKVALGSNIRNVVGQVIDEDRSGAFTDTEIYTALGHDANNILRECLGFASSDLESKKESKLQIAKAGEIRLSELTNNPENKKGLQYIHHILREMGWDSDVITYPL